MLTGHYTVSDVLCRQCVACLGWRFVEAAFPDQRYQVGHTVLERATLDVDVESSDGGGGSISLASVDDDECA